MGISGFTSTQPTRNRTMGFGNAVTPPAAIHTICVSGDRDYATQFLQALQSGSFDAQLKAYMAYKATQPDPGTASKNVGILVGDAALHQEFDTFMARLRSIEADAKVH